MANDSPSSKLIVPGVAGLYEWGSGLSYPLLRFFAGLMLVPHGAQKLFDMFGGSYGGTVQFFTNIGIVPAEFWVIVVGFVEFFGGLAIAFGLLTRPFALAATAELLFAAFYFHLGKGYFVAKGGYEHALIWAFIMIFIFFRGGGRVSIDSKLGKEF